MSTIIFSNIGFWINFIIPFAVGIYLLYTHKEYVLKEFAGQVALTAIYLFVVFHIFFSTTTKLDDTEFWNSTTKSITYFEKWRERVTYTESYKCGKSTCYRTRTRTDFHPAFYELRTTNNETIRIRERDYLQAKKEFGSTFVNIRRMNQIGGGGDKYVSYPNRPVPVSRPHSFINYVAAAKNSVIKRTVSETDIEILKKRNELVDYPKLYKAEFGATRIKRIIDRSGTGVSNELKKEFDVIASNLGKKKHANVIIYLTDQDRSFTEALAHYWDMGKKNDVILVLGMKDDKVHWSDIITFTNNTDFILDMQRDFKGMKMDKELINKFKNSVLTSYVRKPMKEFEYLAENVTLEFQWQILIVIINMILSGLLTWKMLTNRVN